MTVNFPIGKAFDPSHRRPTGPGAEKMRFGGLTDRMAQMFQPITEQFIWGFTAQDVLALWVPRDFTALIRGRDVYQPNNDPTMRDKHPFKQSAYTVYRNFKGLNYSNAAEETLREVETGPGLLIAQSILLGLSTAFLMGKQSLMMSHHDLSSFKHAFQNLLQAPNMEGILAQSGVKGVDKLLRERFLTSLLHEGHFSSGLNQTLSLAELSKHINLTEAADSNGELLKLLKSTASGVKGDQHITYGEALNTWRDRWVNFNTKAPKATRLKEMDRLESSLKRLVFWFNDSVLKVTKPGLASMVNAPALQLAGQPAEVLAVDHLVENLNKFRPFLQETGNLAKKELTATSGPLLGSQLKQNLGAAAEKLFRNVIIRKTVLSVAATLLAGWVVVTVSAIAQRGKAYPANRKLVLKGGNTVPASPSHGARPAFASDRVSVPASQQPTLISRQYRQPAFMLAAASFLGQPQAAGTPWKGGSA